MGTKCKECWHMAGVHGAYGCRGGKMGICGCYSFKAKRTIIR